MPACASKRDVLELMNFGYDNEFLAPNCTLNKYLLLPKTLMYIETLYVLRVHCTTQGN